MKSIFLIALFGALLREDQVPSLRVISKYSNEHKSDVTVTDVNSEEHRTKNRALGDTTRDGRPLSDHYINHYSAVCCSTN